MTLKAKLDKLTKAIGNLGGVCAACKATPYVFRIEGEADERAMKERLAWMRSNCTCGNARRRHTRVLILGRPIIGTPTSD